VSVRGEKKRRSGLERRLKEKNALCTMGKTKPQPSVVKFTLGAKRKNQTKRKEGGGHQSRQEEGKGTSRGKKEKASAKSWAKGVSHHKGELVVKKDANN